MDFGFFADYFTTSGVDGVSWEKGKSFALE